MGSNSRSGKDYGEAGTSGVKNKRHDDDELEERERHNNTSYAPELLHGGIHNGLIDRLVQFPPLGVPQVPVAAMQHATVLQDGYVESVIHQRLKRVNITWNHPAAAHVSVIGSWDNWEAREALQRVGRGFVIAKTLPVAIYHYRFIVDGYFTHAPDSPSAFDHSGYAYNILDLQDYIPETVARFSDVEDPPSPPWSYDNILLNDDEFSRPPPELPPQLQVTVRGDAPTSSTSTRDSAALLPTPSHLQLNHLYIHKTDGDEFVALRSTHRFQHKYVTTMLYKSLPRER